jgi:hypothetical protein
MADAESGRVLVEHGGSSALVPADVLLDCPIAAPSRAQLEELDPCFYSEPDAFVEEHDGSARWYRLLRCKAHGRRFLEETRGSVGIYTRLIAIDATEESPDEIWRRYNAMSDDWLSHLGIAR